MTVALDVVIPNDEEKPNPIAGLPDRKEIEVVDVVVVEETEEGTTLAR